MRIPSLARLAAGFLVLVLSSAVFAGPFVTTSAPINPDGTRATVDLPPSQHMKNVGGSDGAGLCVFTSLTHAARWQNLIDLDGYRRWMQSRPGGGYPEKVDQTLAAYCRSKGIAVPQYVQHTGGDDTFLDLCMKTSRCPGVTYSGRDNFYRGPPVAHMVNLAHLDSSRAAIIDNNRPGEWVWMSRADFLSRWRDMGGGWAVVFLDPPPPPYNGKPESVAAVGQCPGGSCSGAALSGWTCSGGRCYRSPAAPPAPISPDADPAPPQGSSALGNGWHESEGLLYHVSHPRGIYDPISGEFQPLVLTGAGWTYGPGSALPAGLSIPAARAGAPDGILTGVVSHKIHGSPPYSLNGNECSREAAHAALELADDSGRWHLSAVGDVGLLSKVKADVAGLASDLRAKLLVTYYSPAAWQVGQFKLPGGVTLRKPAGGAGRVSADVATVPAADYSTEKLADLCGQPDGPAPKPKPPTPKPTPAPDPQPSPGPTPVIPNLPGWLWAVLGAVLALFLQRRGA